MSPPASPSANSGPYRSKALQLAHRIRREWETSPHQDLKSLVDEVQSAFSEEANHELRQVLFQLSAQLELALVKGSGGKAELSKGEITRLLSAVGRATNVVEAYLDRGEAAKMVIDLHPETFDVGVTLVELLRWNGFLDGDQVEAAIEPVVIHADKDHLMDVLGHMASRFYFARHDPEQVRIVLKDAGAQVEGFFGLVGARTTTQELMSEFDQPLKMEDMQIDMPYTRAVIERHGGALYVAAGTDNASGFGFTLPKNAPNPEA